MPGTNRLIWGNRSAHHVICLFIVTHPQPGHLACSLLETWSAGSCLDDSQLLRNTKQCAVDGGQETRNQREKL